MSTSEILLSRSPPWVVAAISEPDAIERLTFSLRRDGGESSNVLVVRLHGQAMRDRKGVFDRFAEVLRFPSYFGRNWNAFLDCLRDLSWLQFTGMVVAILHSEHFLVDADPDELQLFCKIVSIAAEEWSKADEFHPAKSLHVLMHTSPAESATWSRRLTDLRLDIPTVDTR